MWCLEILTFVRPWHDRDLAFYVQFKVLHRSADNERETNRDRQTDRQTDTPAHTRYSHNAYVLCPDKPPVWPCRRTFLRGLHCVTRRERWATCPANSPNPRASCPLHVRKNVQLRRTLRETQSFLRNIFLFEVLGFRVNGNRQYTGLKRTDLSLKFMIAWETWVY